MLKDQTVTNAFNLFSIVSYETHGPVSTISVDFTAPFKYLFIYVVLIKLPIPLYPPFAMIAIILPLPSFCPEKRYLLFSCRNIIVGIRPLRKYAFRSGFARSRILPRIKIRQVLREDNWLWPCRIQNFVKCARQPLKNIMST